MAWSKEAAPFEPVSGLGPEVQEVILQTCSLWGQRDELELFPFWFPRIFANLGILNGD